MRGENGHCRLRRFEHKYNISAWKPEADHPRENVDEITTKRAKQK